MSSWASLHIGGYEIFSWQNRYSEWYFRKSERVVKTGPAWEVDSGADGGDRNSDDIVTVYQYRMPVRTLRKRLELAGFNRHALEREFTARMPVLLEAVVSMREFRQEWSDALLPIISKATIDDWLQTLEGVTQGGFKAHGWESDRDFGDPLVNFMVNPNVFLDDNPTMHGTNFPCVSLEAFTVAILEFTPDDSEVVLDVTDLVDSGWTDGFEDVLEHSREFTTFYEVFENSLNDTKALVELAPTNGTLTRLLYANVITAMETYLADTFKKQVLNRHAIKRRFVLSHDPFREKKIPIADIFDKLDRLDGEIQSAIDMMSFHNIEKTCALYKAVLATEFPRELIRDLKHAVDVRHDIVHRNGKTTRGERIEISADDVRSLMLLVVELARAVDWQIKDGLLDDVDEIAQ